MSYHFVLSFFSAGYIPVGQDDSVFHLVDQTRGLCHHIRILIHDVYGIAWHGIGGIHPSGSCYGVGLYVPGGHIVQLHFYQRADVIGVHICDKHPGEAVQYLSVVQQHRAAIGGDFADDGFYNTHLVLSAHVVSARKGVALTRKCQRLFAIQCVFPFGEGVAPGFKCFRRIYGYAADGVYQGFKAGEVYLGVVVDLDAVQVFQRLFGAVYAVNSAVVSLS